MKIISLFVFTSLCLFSASCRFVDPVKKERNEITVKVYEKDGVSFSYPDNWRITEDSILEEGIRYINVEDSDNSVFIITLFNSDSYDDLETYVKDFKKNLPPNTLIGKIDEGAKTKIDRNIKGQNYKGIRQKFSTTDLGRNFQWTTDFFLLNGEKFNSIITIQSPDEDWKAAEKEFQIIFNSLKF